MGLAFISPVGFSITPFVHIWLGNQGRKIYEWGTHIPKTRQALSPFTSSDALVSCVCSRSSVSVQPVNCDLLCNRYLQINLRQNRSGGLNFLPTGRASQMSFRHTYIVVLTGTFVAAQVAVGGLLRAVGGRTAAVAREQAARAVICSIDEAATLLWRQGLTSKATVDRWDGRGRLDSRAGEGHGGLPVVLDRSRWRQQQQQHHARPLHVCECRRLSGTFTLFALTKKTNHTPTWHCLTSRLTKLPCHTTTQFRMHCGWSWVYDAGNCTLCIYSSFL